MSAAMMVGVRIRSRYRRTPQIALRRRGAILRGRIAIAVSVVPCVLGAAAAGCALGPSAFEIVDHRSSGEIRRYRETFDEAYYDVDGSGNLTMVLRHAQAARRDMPEITQIVLVKGVWRCIPGTTIAEDTQINSTVTYATISGRSGTTFEGAGSLFFSQDRRGGQLTGALELATLQPKRRIGGDEAIFDRTELSGRFHARREPRLVRQIANDLGRRFGSAKG